jgi:hypothetical protein
MTTLDVAATDLVRFVEAASQHRLRAPTRHGFDEAD